MQNSLCELRQILCELKPTGADGFEGLIAAVLTEVTGVPFRLARGGSQFGVDGRSAYEQDGVGFEGKRYDGEIPRSEVLSKIVDLAISDDGDTDLWILAATTSVSTQLQRDIRRAAYEHGMSTLILDWGSSGVPALAVALALSATNVERFLKTNLGNKTYVSAALDALQLVRASVGFDEHAARLRSEFEHSIVAAEIARRANFQWLQRAFSSRQEARRLLGQPIAPADLLAGAAGGRPHLVSQFSEVAFGKLAAGAVIVLGEEGNGKSWLVAMSWLALENKPLMLIFTADDFTTVAPTDDLEDLLISKLIAQTSSRRSAAGDKRWRRRLEKWRLAKAPATPRLLVVIDGLNQRPNVDWGRLIDSLQSLLFHIGGKLVATTRSAFYRAAVQKRIGERVWEVQVGEWTEAERDAILSKRGVSPIELRGSVATALLNPRLLSIAVDLLHENEIRVLEELSVGRLWFEHMLANERDSASPMPAYEFARTLQRHADGILNRVGELNLDELNAFEGDFGAVKDGRFFVPFPDEPGRYRIDSNGLPIAMAFALLDQLQVASRNGRDILAELEKKVEPVRALDMSAHVIHAALTIACLDPRIPKQIGVALLSSFTKLQNPDQAGFSAFAALARRSPKIFLQVAHDESLSLAQSPNADWVEAALHEAKEIESAWVEISAELPLWLSYFSLEPSVPSILESQLQKKESEEFRARARREINERLESLSQPEIEITRHLCQRREEPHELTKLAFRLAAGKPLAGLVRGFTQWGFASALRSSGRTPYAEFFSLVRFNRCDWAEVRSEIHKACAKLESSEISQTGKWVLTTLLEATGDSDDAVRAGEARRFLSPNFAFRRSWRLVDSYCDVEPCDPGSNKPENIVSTAIKYADIDVSKLRIGMGQSSEDCFLEDARPGIARFEEGIGIHKHFDLISHVVTRKGFALRQGLFEVHRHNCLVRDHHIVELRRQRSILTSVANQEISERDRWVMRQYCSLLSFPLMSASEQVVDLLATGVDEAILLNLMDVLKPLDPFEFGSLVSDAYAREDNRALFIFLSFGRHSESSVSASTFQIVAQLVKSPSENLRAAALSLLAVCSDQEALRMAVNSGWSAVTDSLNSHESWYGSVVLINACERNLLSAGELLERLAPQAYGLAALRLGSYVAQMIAVRIDSAIHVAAQFPIDESAPSVEMQERADETAPTYFSVAERPTSETDILDAFKRMSESSDEHDLRQEVEQREFLEFRRELTIAKADIVLSHFRAEEFSAIVKSDKRLAERWYELLVSLPERGLRHVHNLGLLLASALSTWDLEKAARLFLKLERVVANIRSTTGHSRIPLSITAPWSVEGEGILLDMRYARLDQAENDAQLAMEVLGATMSGKQLTLERFVKMRIGSGHPAAIARALTVVGFSEPSSFSESTLIQYAKAEGFIGRAQQSAFASYQRNVWARHWYREMTTSKDREEFWKFSVLFVEVVDSRFDIWGSKMESGEQPFCLFWPSIEDQLRSRLRKWNGKRQKKLFGDDVPEKVFMGAVDVTNPKQ